MLLGPRLFSSDIAAHAALTPATSICGVAATNAEDYGKTQ